MEITFARARSERELVDVAQSLFQEGFRPYGLPFVLREFWSVEDAPLEGRAEVHYLTMARLTDSPRGRV